MSRVLFFYATNSCGHQKAAESIRKSLHRIAPQIKTFGVDFFTYHYPNIGPFFSRIYVEVMRRIPLTWDHIYDNPEVASFTAELRRLFTMINAPKLYEDLRTFKPDVVVCTQAVPAGFIAAEKQRGKLSLPLFVTLTDYVANPYWPDRSVDHYFVPDREVKRTLMQRNIAEDRIGVTGIPIDDSFAKTAGKGSARKNLGFDPCLPTILIMGGSLGIGLIPEAVEALLSMPSPLQLIVVTGRNQSLYRSLKDRYSWSSNVLILKHSRTVPRLMDASHLLISKPGGLTSAEALSKGLPMIILSPLPGQEERNASYLLRHRVAERCDHVAHLPGVVETFLGSPHKLKRYRARALGLARPYASRDIAAFIARFLAR